MDYNYRVQDQESIYFPVFEVFRRDTLNTG
jgi:hypothetical protein